MGDGCPEVSQCPQLPRWCPPCSNRIWGGCIDFAKSNTTPFVLAAFGIALTGLGLSRSCRCFLQWRLHAATCDGITDAARPGDASANGHRSSCGMVPYTRDCSLDAAAGDTSAHVFQASGAIDMYGGHRLGRLNVLLLTDSFSASWSHHGLHGGALGNC